MSDYLDRLRLCRYIAPDGQDFELQVDNLDRSGGKKVAVHEFPQQNIAEVMDLGESNIKYPLTVYWTGSDCDVMADQFWSALSQKHTRSRPGRLQHPRYGDLVVMPTTKAMSEKLVDEVKRVEIKVEFVTAPTDLVFPVTAVSTAEQLSNSVSENIDQSNLAAAENFTIANPDERGAIIGAVRSFVSGYQSFFSDITAVSTEIQDQINTVARNIITTAGDLLESPTQLLNSLADLAMLPARVTTTAAGLVHAYLQTVELIIRSVPESYAQAIVSVQSLLYALSGATIAAATGNLNTRDSAITAADDLSAITDAVIQFIRQAEDAHGSGKPLLADLTNFIIAADMAKADVLDRSFNLRSERRITITTERTPLDLCYQLYGQIDSLDELIAVNRFSGDSLLLIPRDTEVIYYA